MQRNPLESHVRVLQLRIEAAESAEKCAGSSSPLPAHLIRAECAYSLHSRQIFKKGFLTRSGPSKTHELILNVLVYRTYKWFLLSNLDWIGHFNLNLFWNTFSVQTPLFESHATISFGDFCLLLAACSQLHNNL